MAVIPRSMFSNDGELLTPTNESSFIHNEPTSFEGIELESNSDTWIDNIELPEDHDRIAIIDAMAVVQEIKKHHK